VGHPDSVKAIKEKGLEISGVRGSFNININAEESLKFAPGLAIIATKTQDIEAALKANQKFLKGSVILTTQNGVQADDLAIRYLDKKSIISSIVMFGSTLLEPARIAHNFEGDWIIGRFDGVNDEVIIQVSGILNQVFPAIVSEDIKGMKFLKIFVNANNCIPAILGKSIQESFQDTDNAKISIAIWREGLETVRKSGVKLESLPDFPLERLTKLTSMPLDDAAKVYSGIMVNLSKEPLYGSILQSIKRGKASEIDYINGEFVSLAKANGFGAPLNEKLVELVHRVEKSKEFFSKEELIAAVGG
jgi:2-dehydropantoate 2-reductase